MVFLLIFSPNDAAESFIKALCVWIVFLNRNMERDMFQVSLLLELFNKRTSDAFVLIVGQNWNGAQNGFSRLVLVTNSVLLEELPCEDV